MSLVVAPNTPVQWARALACLSLVLVWPAGSAAATCGGSPGPAGTVELVLNGVTRPFAVRLPRAYDARTPAPLIFLFHPGGMTAQYMQGLVPLLRMWPEAIAVYPQALPRPSVGFRPGWQGRAGDSDDQDLKFFDAMQGRFGLPPSTRRQFRRSSPCSLEPDENLRVDRLLPLSVKLKLPD